MSGLQVVWFLLVGLLLTVYAILDGFDLGVGFWYLRTKKEKEKGILRAAIGPVWDGNEVWLLTGGGALFAAFPPVYATVFSGFYLALILVLVALIFRAVSLEMRDKVDSASWKRAWDLAFGIGSTVAALLLGVALGNILRGVPLDAGGRFAGTFLGLLNPYALLVGLLGLAMMLTHGALYIVLKSDGDLAARARAQAARSSLVYLVLYIMATLFTVATQPQLLDNFKAHPLLWLIPTLALVTVVATAILSRRESAGRAFIASSLSIAALMGTAGASLFPKLVPASNDPALSLTAFNSSSSQLTLWTMLVLTMIGLPLVLTYTIWAYRAFAGKAVAHEEAY
jgi:cytochrome d ubiquinol oxidase subunit II